MTSIGRSRGELEAGFTLLELMVVVTIIGVLLAIGIPTLLGAKERASDAAAKARATQAIKSQKVAASDAAQQFRSASELAAVEPSLTAIPLADGAEPSVLGAVYVKEPEGGIVTLVARSESGKCFWSRATISGHTSYASNDCSTEPASWSDGW